MKIFYIHGIGSAGGGNTVRMLRAHYPDFEILSPDIPVDPIEADEFVRHINRVEHPGIVIGTSLGGFFAMRTSGNFKILINPAMLADTDIRHAIGLGTHPFLNPRKDGAAEYIVDEDYIAKLEQLRTHFFEDCLDWEFKYETYALFGTEDTVVSNLDVFQKHYDKEQCFTDRFGHRLTQEVFDRSLVPLIDKIVAQIHAPLPDKIKYFPF